MAANLGDIGNPSTVENPRRVLNDDAMNPRTVAEIMLSNNERIQLLKKRVRKIKRMDKPAWI